jgi:hypothetical protein
MTRSVRHILRTISVGTMLAVGASTAVAATHAAIGTWKLNIAKSTDESSDPLPKSENFVFADSAQGVSLSTRIKKRHPRSQWDTHGLTGWQDDDCLRGKRCRERREDVLQQRL